MNRPDKFQDTLAEIAIGVVLVFVLAGIVTAGLRAIRVLDDGNAPAPSAWAKGR